MFFCMWLIAWKWRRRVPLSNALKFRIHVGAYKLLRWHSMDSQQHDTATPQFLAFMKLDMLSVY